MFKRNVLAVSLSLGLAAVSGQVMADAIGGGATLPAGVFNAIITGESYSDMAPYIGVGSSAGKRAFYNNDSSEFFYDPMVEPTVHYAGSDSVSSSGNISGYATNDEPSFGPLIQVPFAATSVTVTFNNSDITALNPLVMTSNEVAQVFAGQITNWSYFGYPSKQITVVYRQDGSGTVEIFTRHLDAVATTLFDTDSNFLSARIATPDPSAAFQPGVGSSGVIAERNNIDGAITFVSPDYVDPSDPTEVAYITNRNDSTNYLPTQVSVQATVNSVPVPTTTNPADWAPVFPDPLAGYPIAGFTFLLASSCYASGADGDAIVEFAQNHYTGEWFDEFGNPDPDGTVYVGNHDQYVTAADLIPLPYDWASEIDFQFTSLMNDYSTGGICDGKGGR